MTDTKKTNARKKTLKGTRKNMWNMDPNDLVIVGLDTDHGPDDHPLYDERILLDLEEAFILNIKRYGVIEPVIVRKNGDVPEVVDGRQRVRAAREARKRLMEEGASVPLTIPVIPQRAENLTVMGVMVSLNEQRQADGMVRRARKLERMLQMGATDDDAAIAFGVTKVTIRNWKKLLDCAPEVLKAVENNELPASAAADLSVLTREDQAKKLEELRKEAGEGNKITTTQTTRVRRQSTNSSAATPYKAPRKPVLKAIVAQEASGVDETVLETIKWMLGESDGSSIPGLSEVIESVKASKRLRDMKISDAQMELLKRLKEASEPASSLNKKTISALAKREIVEEFNAEDGVAHIRIREDFMDTFNKLEEAFDAKMASEPIPPEAGNLSGENDAADTESPEEPQLPPQAPVSSGAEASA